VRKAFKYRLYPTRAQDEALATMEITPYGRQEDWEDSPSGWPQRPTYG
jgi:hypothetical protein